jgi:hypothetical protein
MTTANDSGGSSGTAAFTNNNIAGNFIIVFTDCNGSDTTTTPTDSQGNTYTQIFNTTFNGGTYRVGAWYAAKIKSGANTVTTHYGGSNTEFSIIAREYSGLQAITPFDVTASTAPVSGSTAPASGSTTASGNSFSLVVGLEADANGSGQTYAVGSGFGNLTSISTNGFDGIAIEDRLYAAGGAVSANFTLGTSNFWFCAVVTFIASGGSFISVGNKVDNSGLRPHAFSPGLAR